MKNVDLIIKNIMIYTVNDDDQVIKNGCVIVDKGFIEGIGENLIADEYRANQVIDGKGKVLFPGFVNTHIHIFQSLLKGLGADHRLIEWLNLSALPYGEVMGSDMQYEAARLASMEAIKSGCTTLSEFFYTVQSAELAHSVIRGMKDIGIRSVFFRTFNDTGLEYGVPLCMIEPIDLVIKNTEALYNSYSKTDDMLTIGSGPCVTWATTKEGYQGILEYCLDRKMFYSMHIQETKVDNAMTHKYYQMDAVELINSLGFLTENFLAVHCVNLTKAEIKLFAENGVAISHNPMSNLYLGSGFAPIPEILSADVRVALGTDGAASNNTTNMLETMKMAAVCQKALHRDASIIKANQILRMATIEGARALHMDHLVGSIEMGKKADMIIFDPYDLTSFPMHDPVATLVYSARPYNIETSIIDGKVIYQNREFVKKIDEAQFYHRIEGQLADIKKRL